MLKETLETDSVLKLVVYVVVLMLNLILGVVIRFFWKSWKEFKEDQRQTLQDYFISHGKEHDYLASKCRLTKNGCDAKTKETNESITALFAKEDDSRDRVIAAERDIKSTEEKLADHVRRCEIRDQCHDRRENDKRKD